MNKITVHALFRNSSKHIQRTLDQFKEMERFWDLIYHFYENDSVDDTVEQLNNFKQGRDCHVYSYTFGAPQFGSVESILRTSLLSFYRNKLKELAGPPKTELVLLLDSDLIFSVRDLNVLVKSLKDLPEAAMVTANTQQNVPDLMFGLSDTSYYDVWPLRDRFGSQGAYVSSCPFFNEEDRQNWMQFIPVKTLSSFAGFAVIRSSVYEKCSWSSDFHCEHVNFCAEINKYGSIYAIPSSRPRVEINVTEKYLEICKRNGESQKKAYDTVNILHKLSVDSEYNFHNFIK